MWKVRCSARENGSAAPGPEKQNPGRKNALRPAFPASECVFAVVRFCLRRMAAVFGGSNRLPGHIPQAIGAIAGPRCLPRWCTDTVTPLRRAERLRDRGVFADGVRTQSYPSGDRSDCGKCDECGTREHGSKEGNGQGDCAADAEDCEDDGKNADEGLVCFFHGTNPFFYGGVPGSGDGMSFCRFIFCRGAGDWGHGCVPVCAVRRQSAPGLGSPEGQRAPRFMRSTGSRCAFICPFRRAGCRSRESSACGSPSEVFRLLRDTRRQRLVPS